MLDLERRRAARPAAAACRRCAGRGRSRPAPAGSAAPARGRRSWPSPPAGSPRAKPRRRAAGSRMPPSSRATCSPAWPLRPCRVSVFCRHLSPRTPSGSLVGYHARQADSQHSPPPPRCCARRCSAWYDRARRDLPWRAAPGRAARPLARAGQRADAAADHGRHRARRGSRRSWRASRPWPALPRPRSTTCCMRGRAWATIAGRARCTPARRRSWRAMAAVCRWITMSCSSCPASAPTRRRRWRRSPAGGRWCRSTPMSSASWRGCWRVATPLPAARPQLRAAAASLAGAAPAGRSRPGADGAGRAGLHAAPAGLPRLPVADAGAVRRGRGRARALSASGGEEGADRAVRQRLPARARGRGRPVPPHGRRPACSRA